MKPTFKNRENSLYKIDGKDIWISRSAAVGAILLGKVNSNVYVLVEKRSDNMPDGTGLWCLPCGYIDYDENGYDAIRREIYEETSFFVDKYKKQLIFDNNKESFYTHTDPSENRQNIVIWYYFIYDFSKTGLPKKVNRFKNEEVAMVKWLNLISAYDLYYNWAFNHDERIKHAILKFKHII